MKMGQFGVLSTGAVLAIICLAVAQASYYPDDEGTWVDVSGGVVTPIQGDPDFPWLVAVVTMENRIAYCSGSLIHPRAVLTSATCAKRHTFESLVPMEFDLWKRGSLERYRQTRNSSLVIIHEKYDDKKNRNNIAIVIFSEPVVIEDDTYLASLPEPDDQIDFAHCISSGWGFYHFVRKPFSPKKMYPSLIDHSTCQDALHAIDSSKELDSSTFCTDNQPRTGDCPVNLGTPLRCPIVGEPTRYVQVGLAASSYCLYPDLPIAWTDVRAARPWIMEKLSENGVKGRFFTHRSCAHFASNICFRN